jgi:hypothetical protein
MSENSHKTNNLLSTTEIVVGQLLGNASSWQRVSWENVDAGAAKVTASRQKSRHYRSLLENPLRVPHRGCEFPHPPIKMTTPPLPQ